MSGKTDPPRAVLVSRDWEEGERLCRLLEGAGFSWRWFRGFERARRHLTPDVLLILDEDPRYVPVGERGEWLEQVDVLAGRVIVVAPYGSDLVLPEGVRFLRKPVDYRELEQALREAREKCGPEQVRLRRKIETQYLRIRRLEDINRQIVEGMPLAVAALDSEMRLVFANRLFHRMLDVPEGAVATELSEVFEGRLLAYGELVHDFRRVLASGESTRMMQAGFHSERGAGRMLLDIWMTRLPFHPVQVLMVIDDVTSSVKQRDILAMLRKVAVDMRGTLEIERVLFTILTCVTAGVAIGFTRAFLLLVDEQGSVLRGRMGVGPVTAEEARRVWDEIAGRQQSLDELIAAYDHLEDRESVLHIPECERLLFSLSDDALPVAALAERRTYVVRGDGAETVRSELLSFLGTSEFVVVPLISKRRPLGLVVADNRFSGRPITEEQVELLETFSSQAALAIHTAGAYGELEEKVEQLQEAYRQLEAAQRRAIQVEQLAAVGRMAAKVAHEIRNPLVTIGGFARMIHKNPQDSPKVRANAYVIVGEVERLERILSELMNLARPMPPVLEAHNVNRLVDDVVLQEKATLEEKGISIVTDLDEGMDEIMIDADKIKQVLINIVRNAQAAIEEVAAVDPERDRRISITTRSEGDRAVIIVEDTGRGIPDDLRDRVFQPFFTTRSAGTGLGLPIARRIIEDHGGELGFDSAYGKGTRFIIRLPLRR